VGPTVAFKSVNGGGSWTAANAGLGDEYVYTLAIDPVTPATVYAGTSEGVFKSVNGGGSWTPANTGLTDYVDALAIDPVTSTTVYAGTTFSGVFKSVNGGGSWTSANTGLTDRVSVLAIDPVTPATVYAGTSSSGVFKSVNGGGSWTAVNTGLTSPYVSDLEIDPATPTTVYAGTGLYPVNGTGGVFKSANGGESWSTFNDGLANLQIQALTIDRTGKNLHAGSAGNGVFDYTLVAGVGFYTLTPCRIADTRNAPGSLGGPPLVAGAVRDFPVAGVCDVPATAKAVAVNLTIVSPTSSGHLTVYPVGEVMPLASTINFRPAIVRANNAVLPLGISGQISVFCGMPSGSTDFVLDVTGYFQ
jgi:hypothetical protein